MEDKSKFRLRLNLFDGIVLILAVVIGAFLLWNSTRAQSTDESAAPAGSSRITYTVRMNKWPQGESGRIHAGDSLADNIKNFDLGKVTSVKAVPAQITLLDHEKGEYILADIPGYEDVILTVETTGRPDDSGILLDSGYVLRAGAMAYIRGVGYFGSGPVITIDREGQA